MLKIERLQRIEEFIKTNRTASIEALAETFEVSKATVRRDLAVLEEERKIKLTRGGAVALAKGTTHEPSYYIKRHLNSQEKNNIARAASELIQHGETVIIDSSTTALNMPGYLNGKKGLTVATNDLLIAAAFAEEATDTSVVVLGGTVRKNYFTMFGYFAEMALNQIRADKAFMGVDSIDLERGCMLSNIEEASLKRKIISAARELIIICTHDKFSTEGFINICDMKDISTVVTGKELADDIYKRYMDAGVHIIRV